MGPGAPLVCAVVNGGGAAPRPLMADKVAARASVSWTYLMSRFTKISLPLKELLALSNLKLNK